MFRPPRHLACHFACLALLATLPLAVHAKAFTWHIDRNGELVTEPADKHTSPTSEARTARSENDTPQEPEQAAVAPAATDDEGKVSAGSVGILVGLGVGGGYVFGRRLYRRLKPGRSPSGHD